MLSLSRVISFVKPFFMHHITSASQRGKFVYCLGKLFASFGQIKLKYSELSVASAGVQVDVRFIVLIFSKFFSMIYTRCQGFKRDASGRLTIYCKTRIRVRQTSSQYGHQNGNNNLQIGVVHPNTFFSRVFMQR